MTQQSSGSPAFSISVLLWPLLSALIVAVAVAGSVGGVTLGVAPQVSFALVAPFVCPIGGRVQYTALHYSYQRPGESTPQVECFAPDGTHHDVTGQAIFTFFGLALAVVFVPVYLLGLVASLRRPRTAQPQAWQPRARPAGAPAPPNPQSPAHSEIAQRLGKLEALRSQGVITPQEYEQKRKEILSSL